MRQERSCNENVSQKILFRMRCSPTLYTDSVITAERAVYKAAFYGGRERGEGKQPPPVDRSPRLETAKRLPRDKMRCEMGLRSKLFPGISAFELWLFRYAAKASREFRHEIVHMMSTQLVYPTCPAILTCPQTQTLKRQSSSRSRRDHATSPSLSQDAARALGDGCENAPLSLFLSPPFFSGTEKALEEGEAQLKRDSIHQEAKFASWDAHNYVDLLKVQTGESK